MPFLLALALGAFASAFSLRAADPMLVLISNDLSISLSRVALLASAFTLPYAATQVVFGPIGDAVGKIRLIRLNLLMVTLGLVGSALAPNFETLAALRALTGGFAGGIIPVSFGAVADRIAFDRRPVALSRVLLAIVLGQLLGATASGFIGTAFGWRSVFWTAAAIAGLATLCVTVGLAETKAREVLSFRTSLARYGEVLRNPMALRVFAVAAIEGGCTIGIFPLVAPLMVELGLGDAAEAGIAIGAYGIGGALYTFAVGFLMRTLGMARMAALGSVIVGLSLIATAHMPALLAVYLFMGLGGFTFYMLHNTLQILATELLPEARGSGVALYATSFFVGQAAGAAIAAQAVAHAPPSLVFICAGVIMIALSWLAYRLPPRTAKVHVDPDTAAEPG